MPANERRSHSNLICGLRYEGSRLAARGSIAPARLSDQMRPYRYACYMRKRTLDIRVYTTVPEGFAGVVKVGDGNFRGDGLRLKRTFLLTPFSTSQTYSSWASIVHSADRRHAEQPSTEEAVEVMQYARCMSIIVPVFPA